MRTLPSFSTRLRTWSLAGGADYFGVADLTSAREAIRDQGGDAVATFPRAVVMGIDLMDAIVDELPRRAERAVAVNYKRQGYEVINLRLDLLASGLASRLQKAGYRAFPVPASDRADDARICAIFSHKLAAHLAGLGWIGKNCLLITPEHGPRVRWISVLTDAPLPPGKPMAERCGKCRVCVEACPVAALHARPFKPSEPRAVRFDAVRCDQYFETMKKSAPWAVCGMCLYACPHGRKAGARKGRGR